MDGCGCPTRRRGVMPSNRCGTCSIDAVRSGAVGDRCRPRLSVRHSGLVRTAGDSVDGDVVGAGATGDRRPSQPQQPVRRRRGDESSRRSRPRAVLGMPGGPHVSARCGPNKWAAAALSRSPSSARAQRAVRAAGRSPKSVWQLLGAGSVGSQTITALPVLDHCRSELGPRFGAWPFTTGLTCPVPVPGDVVVAEIWPTLFPLDDDSVGMVRDAAQVRATAHALANADRTGALASWFSIDLPSSRRQRSSKKKDGSWPHSPRGRAGETVSSEVQVSTPAGDGSDVPQPKELVDHPGAVAAQQRGEVAGALLRRPPPRAGCSTAEAYSGRSTVAEDAERRRASGRRC